MARHSDRFGPDRRDAIARSRRVRFVSLLISFMVIVVLFGGPALLGQGVFIVAFAVFGVLYVMTLRYCRRPDSADAECLERDELRAATPIEPVAVKGVWSLGARTRGEPARKGHLLCDGTNLRFEVDDDVRFDIPIRDVVLAWPPSFMRPQLDLRLGGVDQTIRFYPGWDLGASIVGPIVAGEWYAQLRELGATPA